MAAWQILTEHDWTFLIGKGGQPYFVKDIYDHYEKVDKDNRDYLVFRWLFDEDTAKFIVENVEMCENCRIVPSTGDHYHNNKGPQKSRWAIEKEKHEANLAAAEEKKKHGKKNS